MWQSRQLKILQWSWSLCGFDHWNLAVQSHDLTKFKCPSLLHLTTFLWSYKLSQIFKETSCSWYTGWNSHIAVPSLRQHKCQGLPTCYETDSLDGWYVDCICGSTSQSSPCLCPWLRISTFWGHSRESGSCQFCLGAFNDVNRVLQHVKKAGVPSPDGNGCLCARMWAVLPSLKANGGWNWCNLKNRQLMNRVQFWSWWSSMEDKQGSPPVMILLA